MSAMLFACLLLLLSVYTANGQSVVSSSQVARRLRRFAIPDSMTVTNPNANKCWTDGNNLPVQWFDNGVEIVRGRYWYKCDSGNLVPIGCITDDKKRVLRVCACALSGHPRVQDDSYVDNGFEYRCVLDTEGYLYFEPASCVTNDSVKHQPGDTWDSPEGVRRPVRQFASL
jgi:hypothetical protein